MEPDNTISYRQYEKPTTTNTVVMKRPSLEIQILANDLSRRLGNTDERQSREVIGGVVDKYSQKLLTSGYSLSQTRRVIISGIRGWERRKLRAKKENGKLFRTSSESFRGRMKKKTVGKTSWFRKRKAKDDMLGEKKGRGAKQDTPSTNQQVEKGIPAAQGTHRGEELRIAAVLFVENTKGGALAKSLREVIERLKGILGYSIKVVERSGTPLRMMFPLTRIGENKECGKEDCTTCYQDSRGESLPPCSKRGVLYENICLKCNPGVGEGKQLSPPLNPPSIYIGETSRSLYERGKEHWRDFRTGQEDSHIRKHHLIHHGGVGEPSFHLRPIMFPGTALKRQIAEAVMIGRWGEEIILNSKSEFNRCKIGRLTIGEEDKSPKDGAQPNLGDDGEGEEAVAAWERGRTQERRAMEVREMGTLNRGLALSPARKRGGGEEASISVSSKKRQKKRKYPILDVNWGEECVVTTPPPPPPPPLNCTTTTTTPTTTTHGQTTTNNLNTPQISPDAPTESKDDLTPSTESKDDLTRGCEVEDTIGVVEDRICSVNRDCVPEFTRSQEDHHPPPPTSMVVMETPSLLDGQTNTVKNNIITDIVAVPGEDRTRAVVTNTPPSSNSVEDDESVVRSVRRGITIGGVPLEIVQKKKQLIEENKTVSNTSSKKKNVRKISSSTPPINRITNYWKRKKDDEECGSRRRALDMNDEDVKNNGLDEVSDVKYEGKKTGVRNRVEEIEIELNKTKMTFTTPQKKTRIGDKIDSFQKLSEGGVCVIGSGRCGYHNFRLVRGVQMKKMSVINSDGSLGWLRREVTIMACAKSGQSQDIDTSDVINSSVGISTNKRARILSENCADKPHPVTQIRASTSDIPGDKTT